MRRAALQLSVARSATGETVRANCQQSCSPRVASQVEIALLSSFITPGFALRVSWPGRPFTAGHRGLLLRVRDSSVTDRRPPAGELHILDHSTGFLDEHHR